MVEKGEFTVQDPLQDLLKELKSELGGGLEESMVALMMAPPEYDAYCLRDALEGAGTREAALIGILTTRSAKVHPPSHIHSYNYFFPIYYILGLDTAKTSSKDKKARLREYKALSRSLPQEEYYRLKTLSIPWYKLTDRD